MTSSKIALKLIARDGNYQGVSDGALQNCTAKSPQSEVWQAFLAFAFKLGSDKKGTEKERIFRKSNDLNGGCVGILMNLAEKKEAAFLHSADTFSSKSPL